MSGIEAEGNKSDALSRSSWGEIESDSEDVPQANRTQFETERRALNKRMASSRAKCRK